MSDIKTTLKNQGYEELKDASLARSQQSKKQTGPDTTTNILSFLKNTWQPNQQTNPTNTVLDDDLIGDLIKTARKAQKPSSSNEAITMAIEDSPAPAKMLSTLFGYKVNSVSHPNAIREFLAQYIQARLAGKAVTLVLDFDLGLHANGWTGADLAKAIRRIEKEFGLMPAFIYPNSSEAKHNQSIIAAAGYVAVDQKTDRRSKVECAIEINKEKRTQPSTEPTLTAFSSLGR